MHAAWSLRTACVLLYWADRLDAVACTARADLVSALSIALRPSDCEQRVQVIEPSTIELAQATREACMLELQAAWGAARRSSRRRERQAMQDVACCLGRIREVLDLRGARSSWTLRLADKALPDPALL